jgi:hypothetical protein
MNAPGRRRRVLEAANALGLMIQPAVLARVDKVIQ